MKRVAGHVKAVDGVSLTIPQGGTLALVGESGCGKTTVGKGILQLIPPTAGSVRYDGLELVGLERKQLREKRAEFQIIFQDPYSSLNPRMRIIDIIEEGMNALNVRNNDRTDHAGQQSSSLQGQKVDALLQRVGLPPETKWRYPHEFSGGQRQRIAIARALAVNPRLLICDEPTSALDVSVQAQILNLLKELQASLGLAYLFITHNISVVEYLADEVAVMYLGRIVEWGSVDEVLGNPKHPYTQALLSAVPVIELNPKREVIRLHGDLPSPANPPAGCHFHPRCLHAMPVCRETYPGSSNFGSTHTAHCHLYPQPQGLGLHAIGGIDHHQRCIHGGQHAVSILGKILVARRIQQVNDATTVFHLHHRTGHGNTPLLLDLHPVGGGMAAGLARLDAAGDVDGTGKQQQLFGERGLACVRVRDDGEGASPCCFLANRHTGTFKNSDFVTILCCSQKMFLILIPVRRATNYPPPTARPDPSTLLRTEGLVEGCGVVRHNQ